VASQEPSERNALSFYKSGEEAFERRDYRTAVQSYRRALERNHSYLKAELGLGMALLELGERRAAKESFERALALDAKNTSARTGLGRAALRNGEIDQAYGYLQAVKAEDPSNTVNNLAFAEYYRRINKAELARGYLEKVLRQKPGQLQALVWMAELEAERGRFSEAERYLEKARAVDAVFPDIFAAKGRVLILQARSERDADRRRMAMNGARDAFAMAADMSSFGAPFEVDLVRLDIAAGQVDRARERALNLAQRYPGLADIDYLSGLLLSLSGRKAGALPYLEESVRRMPTDSLLRLSLDETALETGTDPAGAASRRALALYHASRARAYAGMHRPDLWLVHLKRTLQFDPGSEWGMRELLEYHRARGDYESFLAVLGRMQERYPDNTSLSFRYEQAVRDRKSDLSFREQLYSGEAPGTRANFVRTPVRVLIFDPEPEALLPERPDGPSRLAALLDFHLRMKGRAQPVSPELRAAVFRLARIASKESGLQAYGVQYRPGLISLIDDTERPGSPVDYLLSWRLDSAGGSLRLSVDLIDKNTGRSAGRMDARATGEEAANEICARIASFVDRLAPIRARVIRSGSSGVFLNVGSHDSVVKGAEFVVMRDGKEKGRVRVEETGAYASRALPVTGSAESLHAGDLALPAQTTQSGSR
ncbi:MAG: tetratricopeptide repeat protein, partial [Spirochaetia bacterium]|nr:tetratricopeptide repeat protein [Spirochaetia bacterium]